MFSNVGQNNIISYTKHLRKISFIPALWIWSTTIVDILLYFLALLHTHCTFALMQILQKWMQYIESYYHPFRIWSKYFQMPNYFSLYWHTLDSSSMFLKKPYRVFFFRLLSSLTFLSTARKLAMKLFFTSRSRVNFSR